ncbi:uncharacterized protein LOC133835832 [Drosophila sulfurigaster albostrigata]|uniref:uncharacterized protein LOC133835832 n=1 Tax=Drosophila sulfurigaster albostrigata TaxID=89887 RepID=UPI002D21BD25|nr:uncharacterized protein LOC133835832 [Drosophila sulfurigaster albostrigata]
MDIILIRVCQETEYFSEMKCLKTGSSIMDRKSKLFKCSPYLDVVSILLVKGRIDLIGVEVNLKRPIILPRRHRFTFLLVESCHRRYHHLYDEIVVNELRQKFLIFGLRALVREVSQTHPAWMRRARPRPPEMGSLPRERLAHHMAPFTYTGVDYFGPIDIIVGRRHEKRWGVLFTCLTIRAVHLDIATSLSTDSFLCILKAFIARRGCTRRMMFDNGTNFRGANRVLKDEVERILTRDVETKYPEMEFMFIPPGSPHMGGAWERLVSSTKSILTEILPHICTYVPLDSADSEALTPNHFLLGHSSGIRERDSEIHNGDKLAKGFRISSQLADQFWKRWIREYLPTLTRRTKWFQPPPDSIAVNDIVVIADENGKRNSWPKGVVVDVHRSRDGQVRSAVVRTPEGIVTRRAVKLAKLDLKIGNTQREC